MSSGVRDAHSFVRNSLMMSMAFSFDRVTGGMNECPPSFSAAIATLERYFISNVSQLALQCTCRCSKVQLLSYRCFVSYFVFICFFFCGPLPSLSCAVPIKLHFLSRVSWKRDVGGASSNCSCSRGTQFQRRHQNALTKCPPCYLKPILLLNSCEEK